MNPRKLNTIIPIISGTVMLVWDTLAKDWSRSWLAVVIGGGLMGVINVIYRKDDEDEKGALK